VTVQLRSYQHSFIYALQQQLLNSTSVLAVMPTGAGKTVCARRSRLLEAFDELERHSA
jgi:superfamily II DNA or RNA helicase